MNIAVTSKEDILAISRNMILEKGISSFSMRAIADQCGVAVGSIYNYFPSKTDLLSSAIESIWMDIFMPITDTIEFDCFTDCISCLFKAIKNGGEKYPGFFSIHSLNFASEDKKKGKQTMENYFDVLKSRLITALKQDSKVRKGLFQKELSMKIFVDYVFTLLLTILLDKNDNCNALLEMIENCIY